MSKEQDKELAALYLARSEGKTIQAIDVNSVWHNKIDIAPILYGNRVKPITVEEAATSNFHKTPVSWDDSIGLYVKGAVFGAQWQKDQDNE